MGLIKSWRQRRFHDQILDALGLIGQAWLVPFIAMLLGTFFLPFVFGSLEKIELIPNWLLFLLPFTFVDYLYYWNHRLLHGSTLWPLHRVHHSAERLDIWITSRNSLWTPLFLIYVWFNAVLIYIVKDPQFYIYGMIALSLLDLVRHSGATTPAPLKFFGTLFILPEDHEWHHSSDQHGVNFGANLNIWDKLHGTFLRKDEKPQRLGYGPRGSLANELFWPWRIDT